MTAHAPHEAPEGVPEGTARNGTPSTETTAETRADLLTELDAAVVEGALAHERDCLSFMLASWPWPDEWRPEDLFSTDDMTAQIADLRAMDADGPLGGLLDRIATHVVLSGPTRQ